MKNKKLKRERTMEKYNKKCLNCKRSCKQYAYLEIVRCPLFERKDDERNKSRSKTKRNR